MQLQATRPDLDGGPIRVIRGHDVYRRPDRCPICGGTTDVFLTGRRSRGINAFWLWLRPYPRCSITALVPLTRPAAVRLEPKPEPSFDLGPVQLSPALASLGPEVLRALDCHRAGDCGRLGRLDDPPPEDLDEWCPGAFTVAARNALVARHRWGLVASRVTLGPLGLDVLTLTALQGDWSGTVDLLVPEARGINLGEGLPILQTRFDASGPQRKRRPLPTSAPNGA